MPKDTYARKRIQFLEAELLKQQDLIRRTNMLVVRQAATTTLLIEKGIITNDEINKRVETFFHTNSKDSENSQSESEGTGTVEDNSGRGESGILPDESDRVHSGQGKQDTQSDTGDQPISLGIGGIGE